MDKIKQIKNHPLVKQLADVRNIGLYVFGLIVLSVSWSGLKVIQTNYGLQKQIATLEQESAISELENSNLQLRNKYLESDQFQELAARRQFGLGAPGEKMLIVSKEVALKHAVEIQPDIPAITAKPITSDNGKPDYQKNLESWIDFFRHKQSIDESHN